MTGGLSSSPLGSARRERPTIRDKEQQVYEIDVPAGTVALMAHVAKPSDPIGDESVVVQNPAAGKWKVVVDGWSVPSGSTTYDYLDVVFNPKYGMANVADVS